MTISKTKKLIIFGIEDFAEIAYEYFTYDSQYEVAAFTVDDEYAKIKTLFGPPVVPLSSIIEAFNPDEHEVYCAVVYGNLNRDRADICARMKERGYRLASYISSRAFVWPNARIGEHCFIFEDNTVQPFTEIGDNAVLWSGNHIGHHSVIGDNVFISSHVVISGHCRIGDNCFLGVNSTLANNTTVGEDSWLAPAVMVSGTVPNNSLVKGAHNEIVPLNRSALMRSLERARK